MHQNTILIPCQLVSFLTFASCANLRPSRQVYAHPGSGPSFAWGDVMASPTKGGNTGFVSYTATNHLFPSVPRKPHLRRGWRRAQCVHPSISTLCSAPRALNNRQPCAREPAAGHAGAPDRAGVRRSCSLTPHAQPQKTASQVRRDEAELHPLRQRQLLLLLRAAAQLHPLHRGQLERQPQVLRRRVEELLLQLPVARVAARAVRQRRDEPVRRCTDREFASMPAGVVGSEAMRVADETTRPDAHVLVPGHVEQPIAMVRRSRRCLWPDARV